MPKHSRHHASRHRAMEDTADSVISPVKGVIADIENMLYENPEEWENYLPAARSAIATVDKAKFFSLTKRLAEQRWVIQVLQDFAYHDPDDGGIKDIANWCEASWLTILQDHPDDVNTLEGLGHNWLQRSQATLAKISREEGSGSSYGSSQEGPAAAQRAHSHLFVEARGYLQPAVDFFSRAVSVAEQKESLTGKLLASTAEAYMSLGNVSTPHVGERHFIQALRYLRRAKAIPGFTLGVYLQEYLDNYGRFVN